MDVLVFGGFLGSGKTTIIGTVLSRLAQSGKVIALIENEIGEVGIDDVFFEGEGMKVVPLFGGCVCCQISGSLLGALQSLEAEIDPSLVIVEMTGLALTSGIKEVFGYYAGKALKVRVVSILDLSRWDKLLLVMGPLLEAQLEGADLVLLNKSDLKPPDEAVWAFAKAHAPGARIVTASDREENPGFVDDVIGLLAHKEGSDV